MAPAPAPDAGSEGTTTSDDEPPAYAAQARSKAAEVSKLQKKVEELESWLSEKEAKKTDDLRTSIMWLFRLLITLRRTAKRAAKVMPSLLVPCLWKGNPCGGQSVVVDQTHPLP